MTLQVIGAGFGRTGTMSLKVALEELGFGPCYHMYELLEHPEQAGQWEAATHWEPIDWHALLDGYRAGVDWPVCSFYANLMKANPDAKIVLTVRDPDRWYQSTLATIFGNAGMSTESSLRSLPLRLSIRKMLPVFRVIDQLIWDHTFGGRFTDRRHAIEVFERHNEEVKRHVPPERLLVYQVSEGWAPLCEFLGVAAPDMPFPHLNDSQEFHARIRRRRAIAYGVPVGGLALVGLAILVARWVAGRVR
ncbi:MAG: sulfotransferase family protein [Egibacteraceae bacterium]